MLTKIARDRLPLLYLALALLAGVLVCLPWGFKAVWISRHLGHLTGDWWLGLQRVWLHDAVIMLSILAVLVGLSVLRRALFGCAMLLVSVVYILYCVDLIILFNFNNHLNLVDAQKYAGATLDYLGALAHGRAGILMSLCVLGLLGLWGFGWAVRRCAAQPLLRQWRLVCATLAVSLCLVGSASFALRGSEQYSHAWLYENLFEHQAQVYAATRRYSTEFQQSVTAPVAICQQDVVTQPPQKIVMLMLESWSSVHSRLFAGIHDWTPRLDQIAQQYRYYPNFYANGFTTEDGEIALLTGRFPLPPVGAGQADGGTSFQGFWQVEDSLPQQLARRGYHTSFLTSSVLSFSQTGEWARQLGFAEVLGADNPAFVGQRRFHFNSVADAVLLDDAAQKILAQPQPAFYFIKTVSTHHPFVNPETGEASQQAAFEYMDQVVADFYQRLQAAGFFEDGLLILVGDHHAMVPLIAPQIERFGAVRAPAHVPLVVIGAPVVEPSTPLASQPQLAQQTDVYHSVLHQVTGWDCQSPWRGQLWGERQRPSEQVLFRRGDRRDRLTVLTTQADYTVQLNGDQSRLKSVDLQPVASSHGAVDQILRDVHAFRLGQQVVQTPLPKN